jgi:RNA polymerase sigma-70 factor, ECF subfamily
MREMRDFLWLSELFINLPAGARTMNESTDTTARFEADALAELDWLNRMAFRMARNRPDADDLVQETLLRAFANFDTFSPGTNLKAWLARIMTNAYISGYRRKTRRGEYLTDDIDKFCDARVAPGATRSAELEALEGLPDADVQSALNALPPQFLTAVLLSDVRGLSYDEIAAVMGTPVGTVMSRVHRGRRRLRASLGERRAPHGRPTLDLDSVANIPRRDADSWTGRAPADHR